MFREKKKPDAKIQNVSPQSAVSLMYYPHWCVDFWFNLDVLLHGSQRLFTVLNWKRYQLKPEIEYYKDVPWVYLSNKYTNNIHNNQCLLLLLHLLLCFIIDNNSHVGSMRTTTTTVAYRAHFTRTHTFLTFDKLSCDWNLSIRGLVCI